MIVQLILQFYRFTGCQRVPMYYNEQSKAVLCGEIDYEVLKRWGKGEDANKL